LNQWITRDDETGEERRINIGGKNTVSIKTHDRIVIKTAGGGGWGSLQ
jgi:5-oxoprolinase (ATP-hydrolysing)